MNNFEELKESYELTYKPESKDIYDLLCFSINFICQKLDKIENFTENFLKENQKLIDKINQQERIIRKLEDNDANT
jgi:hypothetical protein